VEVNPQAPALEAIRFRTGTTSELKRQFQPTINPNASPSHRSTIFRSETLEHAYRLLAGGWQVSGILTAESETIIAITANAPASAEPDRI
jgi:hypothetical protein